MEPADARFRRLASCPSEVPPPRCPPPRCQALPPLRGAPSEVPLRGARHFPGSPLRGARHFPPSEVPLRGAAPSEVPGTSPAAVLVDVGALSAPDGRMVDRASFDLAAVAGDMVEVRQANATRMDDVHWQWYPCPSYE